MRRVVRDDGVHPSPRCPGPAARSWSSYPPAPRRGTPSNCAPTTATTPPSAAGILIYKVDAGVDTGNGPITVYDSKRHSGGCTRSPNVHAELSDAPFTPGESFKDPKTGITIAVTASDPHRGLPGVRR